LLEGAPYRFRVRARNRTGVTTEWFPAESSPGTPEYIEQTTAGNSSIAVQITTPASRAWLYENLPPGTACGITLQAAIVSDPWSNQTYSYEWTIDPPSDRPGGTFTEVSGGGTAEITLAAPDRPGFSFSGEPYAARCVVTGDQLGNQGEALFNIAVRVLGDANGNGCTDSVDAAFILQVEQAASPDPDDFAAADINCDGVVDAVDRYLSLYVADNWDGLGYGACE
jgi:hypothetical protein